jgi:hypothetical protein
MSESWPRKKSRLSKANLQAAGASPHGRHALLQRKAAVLGRAGLPDFVIGSS